MYCKVCGETLKSGAAFCGACGTAVEVDVAVAQQNPNQSVNGSASEQSPRGGVFL